MRARLRDALDERVPNTVRRPEFLVYVMGAYKAWTPEDFIDEEADVDTDSLGGPFAPWDDRKGDYTEKEALEFMMDIRDGLRTGDESVNAFLAIDPDIPLDEMDAATQSIEFAKAANVTALVVPAVGKNFGVGVETGSVLENNDTNLDRIVFLHEDIPSQMRKSVSRRWDSAVYAFEDQEELQYHLRKFIRRTMGQEHSDDYDLEPL